MNPEHDPSALLPPMQSNSHKSSAQITLTQLGQQVDGGGQSAAMAMQHMNANQGVIVQNMGIGMNGSGQTDGCQSLVFLILSPPTRQT